MVRVEKLEVLAAQYMALTRAERIAFINMLSGITRAEAQVADIDREVDSIIEAARLEDQHRRAATVYPTQRVG